MRPEEFADRINGRARIRKLAASVYEGLFSDYMENMVSSEKFDSFLLRVKDDFPSRLLYCIRVLFIPTKEDVRLFPLPAPLAFLQYVIRPVRLLTKYLCRLVLPGKRK